MSSTAQTGETHVGEPSKSHASPPPSAPPLQSSHHGCRVSEDETGEQLIKRLERKKGKEYEAKNTSLSHRAAPIPPPIHPPGFKTEHLPHAFPPRPEPAQTNEVARKRRHYPRPLRVQLDLVAQNDEFAPPDKEIDFAPASLPNCFHYSEPLLERLRSKKRGAVRCAPKAPSHPAGFPAKPEEEYFGKLIDFSDFEFDIGEDDGAAQHFADLGTDRRCFEDRRMMPPSERGRLHGAFTGGFAPGYFDKQRWEDDDGVLRTEAMPSFNKDLSGDVFEPAQEVGTLEVQGIIEMGIAQSRENDFGGACFGDRQRGEKKDRAVPPGLVALARTRGRGDEEEEASVGATKYMLDEMHHKNMVRALKGAGKKESEGAMVDVEIGKVETGRATDNENIAKSLQALDTLVESVDSWMKQPSKKRRIRRTLLQARTIDTREVESE